MDYKEAYLRLKQRLLTEKTPSEVPLALAEELRKLKYVADDKILEPGATAVILSLIESFKAIEPSNIRHGLEISQHYAVKKSPVGDNFYHCDKCQIVLRYEPNTVCFNQGSRDSECNVTRGKACFYIKKSDKNTSKYSKIMIVKLGTGSLSEYSTKLYQNQTEAENLEEAANTATSQGQTDFIRKNADVGSFDQRTPEGISQTNRSVGQIVDETRKASVESQLSKMNKNRMLSTVPSAEAISAANVVAKNISGTKSAIQKNLASIMVPGNDPIPLDASRLTRGTIGNSGILTGGAIGDSASIPIDANLNISPVEQILQESDVAATTQPQGDILNKVMIFFKKMTEGAKKLSDPLKKSSVIPVSKHLCIMVPLSKEEGAQNLLLQRDTEEEMLSPKAQRQWFETSEPGLTDKLKSAVGKQASELKSRLPSVNESTIKSITAPIDEFRQKIERTLGQFGTDTQNLTEDIKLSDISEVPRRDISAMIRQNRMY